MDKFESLSHTSWDCKYHVIFIPKCRRRTLYTQLRQHLGEVFRKLAAKKESRVEEGHLMPDHVHMMQSIPPKYAVSQVVGFIKGKSAIHLARVYGERKRNFVGQHFWARGYFVSTVGRDEAVIREYIKKQEDEDQRLDQLGLPSRMRSDNGVPFAAYTLGRLSRLSVWLLKLGVLPELIEPGKPQQNGRHERMHRTLKDETLRPPAGNAAAQQRKFNHWRREFNEDRPHEAHDGLTPADLHVNSTWQMPSKLLAPEYPDRFEVRYVSANGGIRWRKRWVNVSSVLIGEHVGLEEVDDGQWDVYFANYRLGRLNERFMRIEDNRHGQQMRAQEQHFLHESSSDGGTPPFNCDA